MTLPEGERKMDKKEKPFTKVIVRRLPPSIDQATFLHQVSPVPDYNCIYTVKGDSSLGEYAFSRIYINFCHPEDVYSFKERFDNYVFLDNKGHEYPAVVEFAPFQKIPKKRGKARTDPKCGTIESDPAYVQFIELLNKPVEPDEKPEYSLQLTSDKKNETSITTPLLEFIKNKRAQRMKIREIRREERKRKEFDKRRERFDERKKHPDDNFSNRRDKSAGKDDKVEGNDYKEAKFEKEKDDKFYYRGKDRKYQEHRKYEDRSKEIKPRYPKKEYLENKEVKDRDFRPKFGYKKDEVKQFPKKVKKYSEKREERKMVAQRAEQDKSAQSANTSLTEVLEGTEETPTKPSEMELKTEATSAENKTEQPEKPSTVSSEPAQNKKEVESPREKSATDTESKENSQKDGTKDKEPAESHSQRRIRNKDRPTIAIYRPGMLSKRKQETDTTDKNCNKNESKSEGSKN
ncbi:unnamed protein product [Acanthoscelides obtectus]|uniref:UPF3 domain-containing protein n=1 Tax=Acanthoscelides obtectus TaxID=200917 RepID=A0A9P0PQ73_ACAOB|nr:unnamed protein product [Acanthoscelides obtectus]CAK1623204.1 Regulator of nonsense transcripts 3A [Acanthoscelides obtectus]